ncbi:MAG TPA: S-adenosyl-l-methionine hydroxide adenosyltransferase family protein [Chryseosolibacter sp.]|nr:S-adenosyl-l-methionine hydroxide adenosyltransferase family protein [Chryseosolibacter sp.]
MTRIRLLLAFTIIPTVSVLAQPGLLVLQTDFGVKDGAVAAMKGVALTVSRSLVIHDLTHEIPPYNIWEAAFRLKQAAPYWPAGTVFVSVVDPGVGSERRSVVLKTSSGHYFVTPDNGTLTLVAEALGIEEVRQIDEAINRLKDSQASYTFHGRDVYAYTGARLASGMIAFEEVGPLTGEIVRIPYKQPVVGGETVEGTIEILDVQYGNVWTNIDAETIEKAGVSYGDKVIVSIYERTQLRYKGSMTFGRTFSDVPNGMPVAYLNSLLKFSVALNMGNFAGEYKIGSGPEWRIIVTRTK